MKNIIKSMLGAHSQWLKNKKVNAVVRMVRVNYTGTRLRKDVINHVVENYPDVDVDSVLVALEPHVQEKNDYFESDWLVFS